MKTILVIEDTEMVREEILDLLTFEGFNAVGAANGREGIVQAQTLQPDLIVCDVSMPEVDGYQVAKTLQKEQKTRLIPFIFLTAKVSKADIRYGMELGVDDYLTKPFLSEELLSAISTRLARRELVDEMQEVVVGQYEKMLDDLRCNIHHSLPHELLTPLNGIIGYADMLKTDYETLDSQEIGSMANDISLAAHRLFHVIQNFLVFAQIELLASDPDKIHELRQHCLENPADIIAEAVRQKAEQTQRDADVTLSLDSACVQITADNLRKIVEEIVDNALKFSPPGTPIHVTTIVKAGEFSIQVKDFGRGMTPNQIANSGAYMQFERGYFEQEGAGLGMSIAKRLIELHGGRFSIESTPAVGTTVHTVIKTSVGSLAKTENSIL